MIIKHIYENQMKSININGNLWKSKTMYETQKQSLKINNNHAKMKHNPLISSKTIEKSLVVLLNNKHDTQIMKIN